MFRARADLLVAWTFFTFFHPMYLSIRGTSDAVNGYFVSTRVLRFYFILGAFLSFIHNCVGSLGPRSKVISHIETVKSRVRALAASVRSDNS